MGKHVLLSASSSHRWLACPPSAKLCAGIPDKGSEYAAEGTDAHALCEYKVLQYLGKKAQNPAEALSTMKKWSGAQATMPPMFPKSWKR